MSAYRTIEPGPELIWLYDPQYAGMFVIFTQVDSRTVTAHGPIPRRWRWVARLLVWIDRKLDDEVTWLEQLPPERKDLVPNTPMEDA